MLLKKLYLKGISVEIQKMDKEYSLSMKTYLKEIM